MTATETKDALPTNPATPATLGTGVWTVFSVRILRYSLRQVMAKLRKRLAESADSPSCDVDYLQRQLDYIRAVDATLQALDRALEGLQDPCRLVSLQQVPAEWVQLSLGQDMIVV